MGKKKSRAEESSWEEASAASTASSWTTGDAAYTEQLDTFHVAIEDLSEKRRETREKALAQLIGFLREAVRVEDVMQNETTIISRCINCIRRGSNLEVVLAAQVFGLHLLTLPEQDESHFREAQFDLQRAAASGATTEVRVAAIDTLSMACFVSTDDDHLCLEVMERLQALWGAGEGRASASAVRGWCLLFTRLTSGASLSSERTEAALTRLVQLLSAKDIEVRGAAGEALALLYHCSRGGQGALQRLAEEDDWRHDTGADDEEDEDEGEVIEASEEVVGQLRKLAVAHHTLDRGQRSKKDRAAMKATFRGVLATVERGSVPSIKVKLQHGDTLVVDTLAGSVQLAAVKKYLAGGFQVHLQRNTLLHAMFHFTPREGPAARLTAQEKRLLRSPSSEDSKWRTSERKGDRAFKSSRHVPPIVYEEE